MRKRSDFKLSTVSVIMGIIVFLGATSPFWHFWAEDYPSGRFMGFTSLETFLAAFGHVFSLFCCAIFVLWVTRFIEPENKKIIKIASIVGGLFVAIGAYFLLWIFSPAQDFPNYVYEIAFSISAIIIAYGMYNLNNFAVNTIFKNKYNVNNLTNFIFRMRDKHFFPMALNAINTENRGKIEKDIDKFNEEVFETLEEMRVKENFDIAVNSFRERYERDINTKITTEAEQREFEDKLKSTLLQIAEMFHDHMLGNKMEKTMVFEIVERALESVKNKISDKDEDSPSE